MYNVVRFGNNDRLRNSENTDFESSLKTSHQVIFKNTMKVCSE